MPTLALRIMDGSASAAEQRHYAQRLIAVGRRLQCRAEQVGGASDYCVVDTSTI